VKIEYFGVRYNNKLYKLFDGAGISVVEMKSSTRLGSKLIQRNILYKIIGSREPTGKPKRWTEAAEEDSKKKQDVRNWEIEAMDRRGWRIYSVGQGPISDCRAVEEE